MLSTLIWIIENNHKIYNWISKAIKFIYNPLIILKNSQIKNSKIFFLAFINFLMTIFTVTSISYCLLHKNFFSILIETSIICCVFIILITPSTVIIINGIKKDIEKSICLGLHITTRNIFIFLPFPLILYSIYIKTEYNLIFYIHVVFLILSLVAIKLNYKYYLLKLDENFLYKISLKNHIIRSILTFLQGMALIFYLLPINKISYDPIYNEFITKKVFEKSKVEYFSQNYNLFLKAFSEYTKTQDLYFYSKLKDQSDFLTKERQNLNDLKKTLTFNTSKKIVNCELDAIDFIENTLIQLERLQKIPSDLSEKCDLLYYEIKTCLKVIEPLEEESKLLEQRIKSITLVIEESEKNDKILFYKDELSKAKHRNNEILKIMKNYEIKISDYRTEISKLSMDISIKTDILNELIFLLNQNEDILLNIKEYHNNMRKIITRKLHFSL